MFRIRTFGTLLQVEGDVRSGFRHDITRNHNASTKNRGRSSGKLSQIGVVADKHVHDTPDSGDTILGATDTKDDVERAAMAVAAPGPSMNPTEEGNAVRLLFSPILLTSYSSNLCITAPCAPGSFQRLPVVGAESY